MCERSQNSGFNGNKWLVVSLPSFRDAYPRFVNMLHADVIGELRFLPKYQTISLSRAQPDLEGRGTHCDFGILGVWKQSTSAERLSGLNPGISVDTHLGISTCATIEVGEQRRGVTNRIERGTRVSTKRIDCRVAVRSFFFLSSRSAEETRRKFLREFPPDR